jgi:hypothetical protein
MDVRKTEPPNDSFQYSRTDDLLPGMASSVSWCKYGFIATAWLIGRKSGRRRERHYIGSRRRYLLGILRFRGESEQDFADVKGELGVHGAE